MGIQVFVDPLNVAIPVGCVESILKIPATIALHLRPPLVARYRLERLKPIADHATLQKRKQMNADVTPPILQ